MTIGELLLPNYQGGVLVVEDEVRVSIKGYHD